ncbi:MAG: hypothetical protein RLY57_224 [Candidatus Parcubacteria bacterium]|jgi:hypothetical protein
MHKNPTYLILLITILISTLIWYRFNDFVINKNFVINVAVNCNTEIEQCFVSDCNTEIDSECDQEPYKKISILKKYAPACLEEHSCENFKCSDFQSCMEINCSEASLDEGEICSSESSDNEPDFKLVKSTSTVTK